MDIEIPENVTMFTQEWRNGQWEWGHYCFPHAVLRALEGEKVKLRMDTTSWFCDDCKNFGEPNHHDLSSLRRRRI